MVNKVGVHVDEGEVCAASVPAERKTAIASVTGKIATVRVCMKLSISRTTMSSRVRDSSTSLGMTTGCNVTLLAEIEAVHCFTFLPDTGLSVQRAAISVPTGRAFSHAGETPAGPNRQDACATTLRGVIVDLIFRARD